MGVLDYIVARLEAGNDCRVLICAKDSETGIGKTCCALDIANEIQQALTNEFFNWRRSCIHPVKYRQFYETEAPMSVVIWDDCEKWIDNRRAMSKVNVDLSNIWATQRIRQIVSILTFPSWADVDDRLRRYAHVKILITERGLAHTYTCHVNEVTRESYVKGIRLITGVPASKRDEVAKNIREMGAKPLDRESITYEDLSRSVNYEKLTLLKIYYNDLIANEYVSNFDELPSDEAIIQAMELGQLPPGARLDKEISDIEKKKKPKKIDVPSIDIDSFGDEKIEEDDYMAELQRIILDDSEIERIKELIEKSEALLYGIDLEDIKDDEVMVGKYEQTLRRHEYLTKLLEILEIEKNSVSLKEYLRNIKRCSHRDAAIMKDNKLDEYRDKYEKIKKELVEAKRRSGFVNEYDDDLTKDDIAYRKKWQARFDKIKAEGKDEDGDGD